MAAKSHLLRAGRRWYVVAALVVGSLGAANDVLDWTRTLGITWQAWLIFFLISIIVVLVLELRERQRALDAALTAAHKHEAGAISDLEAVIEGFEKLQAQIDDSTLHQTVWRTGYEHLFQQARTVIEPMYQAWLGNTEGLPPPREPSVDLAPDETPGQVVRAQYRQLIENQLTRLRDIAGRQRAKVEPVGRAQLKLAIAKDLLLQASVEAQNLLDDFAARPRVRQYAEQLRRLVDAAISESLAHRIFSNESFPRTTWSHPRMEPSDVEFLVLRQKRLAEVQTQLAASDIRDDFDPEDWKSYW